MARIAILIRELWPNGDWAYVCPDHPIVGARQYTTRYKARQAAIEHLDDLHVSWTVRHAVSKADSERE